MQQEHLDTELLDLLDDGFDGSRSAPSFFPGSTMVPVRGAAELRTPFSAGSLPDLSRADSTTRIPRGRGKPQASSPQPFGSSPLLLDASSNSGGELPDFSQFPGGELGDDMSRHREKNRAAQKRFRQRQKARMATSAQQVQELAKQMQTLLLEKQHLEAQNRVLQHTVKLSSRHIQDTAAEKEAYAKQQERIIMETSRVYWRGTRQEPLKLEDVKTVTMESFINIFEHFLGRYRTMLESGGKDPSTPAGKELRETVLDRRQEEARAALFSDWVSAAYAWNKEEMSQGMQPPSLTFWTKVLDNLELSEEQQQAMLAARRRLLTALSSIRQEREKIILELGLALLQKQTANGQSVQEKQLRDSLELEREAVLDFFFTVVDSTFHPWQEAAADLYSHPWHPDLWLFCNILASRHKGEPPDISASGSSGGASLLPHFSAAEMLWTPILARGAGLQLKRVLASRETPKDVLAAAARPLPTIAKMKDMTMYDLFCGKHLESDGESPEQPPQLQQQQQQLPQPHAHMELHASPQQAYNNITPKSESST